MECYGCGHELTESDPFCPMCGRGRRVPSSPTAASAEEAQPSPEALLDPLAHEAPPSDHAADTTTITPEPTDHEPLADAAPHEHAGFWRRAGGWVADYVITSVATIALTFGLRALLLPQNYSESESNRAGLAVLLIVLTVLILYRWAGDSMGGTLGKRLFGVRLVLDGTDHDAGFGSGMVRLVVSIASGLPLGLGYFAAAWDRKGQTWHDKAAGTIAVRADAPLRVLVPALVLGIAALAAVAVVAAVDLDGRNDPSDPVNIAAANSQFRRDYLRGCREGSDWVASGITDSARVDRICGCVADVILAHYTLDEVREDNARLAKDDPAGGYTKFLSLGPYGGEVTACFRT